eukprot:363275-Chlamydomonas_euryale.AAC.16
MGVDGKLRDVALSALKMRPNFAYTISEVKQVCSEAVLVAVIGVGLQTSLKERHQASASKESRLNSKSLCPQ